VVWVNLEGATKCAASNRVAGNRLYDLEHLQNMTNLRAVEGMLKPGVGAHANSVSNTSESRAVGHWHGDSGLLTDNQISIGRDLLPPQIAFHCPSQHYFNISGRNTCYEYAARFLTPNLGLLLVFLAALNLRFSAGRRVSLPNTAGESLHATSQRFHTSVHDFHVSCATRISYNGDRASCTCRDGALQGLTLVHRHVVYSCPHTVQQ
jgi:hypothetical protein